MKTKVIFLISAVAVVTLSFTFAATNKQTITGKAVATTNGSQKSSDNEPAGGFVSEDRE